MKHTWSNWANQVAVQQKLSSGARIVLGKLAELADDAGQGVASNQWIIQLTGLSKNTVTRSFRVLQDEHIIWRFRRYQGSLKRDSGFILLEDALLEDALSKNSNNTNGTAQNTKDAAQNTGDIARDSNNNAQKSTDIVQNSIDVTQNARNVVQDTGDTTPKVRKTRAASINGYSPKHGAHNPRNSCNSRNAHSASEVTIFGSDKSFLEANVEVEKAVKMVTALGSLGLKNLLNQLESSDNLLQKAHYLSVLAHVLFDNCQTKYAALVNTFRADWQMFSTPEAPFVEVSSLSYELATQNLSRLVSAPDPWGALGALLKNRLLQMRRQYWQNTKRHSCDIGVLSQIDDSETAFRIGELGVPLVILEEMPNALEAIRLVTEIGVNESMAFAVTKRLIEIAMVTPANLRPKIVGADKFLASCGLSSQVAKSWNLFLVGGRGDSGILGNRSNPLTPKRLQNLLASLAAL